MEGTSPWPQHVGGGGRGHGQDREWPVPLGDVKGTFHINYESRAWKGEKKVPPVTQRRVSSRTVGPEHAGPAPGDRRPASGRPPSEAPQQGPDFLPLGSQTQGMARRRGAERGKAGLVTPQHLGRQGRRGAIRAQRHLCQRSGRSPYQTSSQPASRFPQPLPPQLQRRREAICPPKRKKSPH